MSKSNSGDSFTVYEVGYCRPPKDTQWKKGQSGNPKGRPKRSDDIISIARRIGKEKRVVMIDGKKRKLSFNEMIVYRIFQEGANGGRLGVFQQIDRWDREDRRRKDASVQPGWTIIDARPVFDNEIQRPRANGALQDLRDESSSSLQGPEMTSPDAEE